MSDEREPKLTPEAVKLLNELAAGRTSGLNLTSEAERSLEKILNVQAPEIHKGQKASSCLLAVIYCGLAIAATIWGIDMILADPKAAIEQASGYAILSVLPMGLFLVAWLSWKTYRKL